MVTAVSLVEYYDTVLRKHGVPIPGKEGGVQICRISDIRECQSCSVDYRDAIARALIERFIRRGIAVDVRATAVADLVRAMAAAGFPRRNIEAVCFIGILGDA
jgi:hypothetical protein